MKPLDLVNSIRQPTKQYSIDTEDGTSTVKVAQLSILNLADVNRRLDDIDLWEHILDTFFNQETTKDLDLDESATIDEVQAQVDPEAMISFLKGLTYSLQIEVIWESFKVAIDPAITKEHADKIYSFGFDDSQQLDALMFALQGISQEELENRADSSKKEEPEKIRENSVSEDEE